MRVPKPLLEWLGTTLIEYQVRQLHDAGVSDVIAVIGHGAADIRPLAERAGARAVLNEHYAEGRASSLRAGASAITGDCDAVIILSVDQPRPADVTRRLLAEHSGGITVPVHSGRRGHPVVLSVGFLPELRKVTEEAQGLRAVIAQHDAEVREVAFDSAVVLLDLNTPEDYEEARKTYEVKP
jgi:CTP:molybdopterin cytidylyltransferase MocA